MDADSKILIIGIDNAGKTSILFSLQGKKNLADFANPSPTKNIDIKKVERGNDEYVIWDFGGQGKYRKNNIEELMLEKANHFKTVKKIIFVIDIQDQDRYSIAIDYLRDILKVIGQDLNQVKISIFLHKFDPGLDEQEAYLDENLRKLLLAKIEELVPEDYDLPIFKTTIYTIFEKSLYF